MWHGMRDFIIPQVYDDAMSYQELIGKLMREINDLWDILSGKLTDKLVEKLNQIMVQLTYIEEEECIVFKLNGGSGNDVHEFDADSGTMYIRGEE